MSDLPPIQGNASIQLDPIKLEASATVHSPIPDDHPYFALIGRATARWAQFERTLELCIWELLGTDQATAALQTERMMARALFARLREELERTGRLAATQGAFDALGNQADGVRVRRNRIVHDPWYVSNSGEVGRAQGGQVFGFSEVPEAEMQALLTDVDALIRAAFAFFILCNVRTDSAAAPATS